MFRGDAGSAGGADGGGTAGAVVDGGRHEDGITQRLPLIRGIP